jgi:hypothetical protein
MKCSPFCEGEVPFDNVPSKYTKNVALSQCLMYEVTLTHNPWQGILLYKYPPYYELQFHTRPWAKFMHVDTNFLSSIVSLVFNVLMKISS